MEIIIISKTFGTNRIIIDDDACDIVSNYQWHLCRGSKTLYAISNVYVNNKRTALCMHRLIMGITDPKVVIDHINRNGLDNRKINLRKCTKAENSCNRSASKNSVSKYLGVHYNKLRRKWVSSLRKNGELQYMGGFDTEREAAIAYNNKAKELHGEFANLNDIYS